MGASRTRRGAQAGLVGWIILAAAAAAGTPQQSTTVKARGQAAIYGNDVAMARDKALADAVRKAVEQAIGVMVKSETVTENYQLISDKILSNSKGYVRKYKLLSESQEGGVYVVDIEAEVSSGNLHNDLDGILAVLKAKGMPRVLVMVAEQNVGQPGAAYWWGEKGFSTNLDAVENAFIDAWTPKGFTFVDRQALAGKLSVGPALTNAEPSDLSAVKEFALGTGAEVVVIGKAVATDNGAIMGTRMRSIRGNISVRILNVDTGTIIATSTKTTAVGHIDPTTGGTQVLGKLARTVAGDLLGKVMTAWQSAVGGSSTLMLKVSKVKKSRYLREIAKFLGNEVRGVEEVRQRSYQNKVAELEVAFKGSAQDLAIELEEKAFSGFQLEIDGITANVVTATMK